MWSPGNPTTRIHLREIPPKLYQSKGANVATNTTVLILVTAMAALVLTGALALVVYKTRNQQRHGEGETIRDQVEEDTLRLRRQEVLADQFDARAHAAQVEVDIKTVRACSLQEQATVHRSEAATSRDQLNELRDQADKLTAATQPPGMPRLAG
jgi:cytochrome b